MSSNHSHSRARDAIERAIGLAQSKSMERDALELDLDHELHKQRAELELERLRLRIRVMALHGAFACIVLACIWLRVAVLGSNYPELGDVLISIVLFLWGQRGFEPSTPVLARSVARLEPAELEHMLSLRPASQGNSLTSSSPPPGA